ncbi:hypothetical protein AB0F46_41125 [Streptomyces sp. NPDC026665]|uniref:hypothetical protein n=1 Tax=Streptomyces sp. NPDC026665 TaxID=3154798 RepID=UPI0033D16742
MPEPTDLPIQDRYAAQLIADLEANRAQQTLLAERLDKLKADEAFLVRLQSSVPAQQRTQDVPGAAATITPSPQDAPAVQEATVVPSPRATETTPAAKTRRKQNPAKKTTPKRATAKTKVKTPPAEKTPKQAEPTLGVLLQDILTSQTEPRTAAEIVSELERTHPERARDVNTVRNTLERLVAKTQAERSKQGSTVYYTGIPDGSGPAVAQTGTKSSPAESAAASEEVPATI